MKRTFVTVGGVILLGLCHQASAEPGPVLNPASGPAASAPAPFEALPDNPARSEVAPSPTVEETIQPGAVESAESPPVPTSPPMSAERWRYKQYQGRWWYFTPDQRWFYWEASAWRESAPGVQPYGGVSISNVPSFGPPISFRQKVGINPDLIPVWRGPPPRYGAPPFAGMPRYNGEPYMMYYGRLYRLRGAYANGFEQFSGPPVGYYYSGNGRVGIPGYNNW